MPSAGGALRAVNALEVPFDAIRLPLVLAEVVAPPDWPLRRLKSLAAEPRLVEGEEEGLTAEESMKYSFGKPRKGKLYGSLATEECSRTPPLACRPLVDRRGECFGRPPEGAEGCVGEATAEDIGNQQLLLVSNTRSTSRLCAVVTKTPVPS